MRSQGNMGIKSGTSNQADSNQVNKIDKAAAASLKSCERLFADSLYTGSNSLIGGQTDPLPKNSNLTAIDPHKGETGPVKGLYFSFLEKDPMLKTWFCTIMETLNLLAKKTMSAQEISQASTNNKTQETEGKIDWQVDTPRQTRVDLDLSLKHALIKFQLMRFQLQANYRYKDVYTLKRQASPISNKGYARGSKTQLWEIVREIRTQEMKEHGVNNIKKKIRVLPSRTKFDFESINTEIYDQLDQSSVSKINQWIANKDENKAFYIKRLNIQLMHKNDAQDVKVDHFMGNQGLRLSLSECAEIIAESLCKMIENGSGNTALKLLKDRSTVGGDFKQAFAGVNLASNMAIALPVASGIDPLTKTNQTTANDLLVSFDALIQNRLNENLPQYVRMNLEVLRRLLISQAGKFFTPEKIPHMIAAEFIDERTRAQECIVEIEKNKTEESSLLLLMERFYQVMQNLHHLIRFQLFLNNQSIERSAANEQLQQVIKNLLPKLDATQEVDKNLLSIYQQGNSIVAPHGLAILQQISAALGQQDDKAVAILPGTYFESEHSFAKQAVDNLTSFNLQEDASLLSSKKVIVMEPHPNNAALDEINPHNPTQLIDAAFEKDRAPCTIIMDVTLNHLGEQEIKDALIAAQPYIKSGKLNLILLFSGAKFMQHGMDLVSMGGAIAFNNNEKQWKGFNQKIDESHQTIPTDDALYLAKMLSANRESISLYLDRIRANTKTLREKLTDTINGEGVFELCASTDNKTVYIALKPSQALVAKYNDVSSLNAALSLKGTEAKAKIEEFDPDKKITGINQILYQRLLSKFKDSPNIERLSFGFNITAFSDCGKTIRIAVGIEETALIEYYAEKIVELNNELNSELLGVALLK